MGVSGSGKSTVGAAIAQRLRVPFADADDFHPPENIAKMASGRPLDDHDRQPWLETLGGWLAQHEHTGAVLSCSALKRSYRDLLHGRARGLRFLHLSGTPEVVEARLAARAGHFMPPSLLRSQFATLEPLAPDEQGTTIGIDQDVDAIVDRFLATVSPTSNLTKESA
ncbi:gluconokinase [Nocardioides sp. KC13]|uniref:Gluconokinase n=1 Tax=Nocardioides turkmenicus TaxID=2711220 RepID=A0A6M1R7C5_9ACTN|nr:gluconokinase [Nocardioides sp. KC13]NGN96036.1 gluconokinase [Nocardioides sp. KC13]